MPTGENQPFFFSDEPNEREQQCLTFCLGHVVKLKIALNKTYKEGKEIGKIDETRKELQKIMPAKLALAQIIRAIKKRDYMLLNSDAVPEIDQIKTVIPEILQFAEDIRELRAIQSGFNSIQKRNDSADEERPTFQLPQLPSRNKGQRTNQSMMGTTNDSRKQKSRQTLASAESGKQKSPTRHSMDVIKLVDKELMMDQFKDTGKFVEMPGTSDRTNERNLTQ